MHLWCFSLCGPFIPNCSIIWPLEVIWRMCGGRPWLLYWNYVDSFLEGRWLTFHLVFNDVCITAHTFKAFQFWKYVKHHTHNAGDKTFMIHRHSNCDTVSNQQTRFGFQWCGLREMHHVFQTTLYKEVPLSIFFLKMWFWFMTNDCAVLSSLDETWPHNI